jgi:hypothetical protein
LLVDRRAGAAKSPRSEQLAATLVVTIKMANQLKALMPVLETNLKSTMLIGCSTEIRAGF